MVEKQLRSSSPKPIMFPVQFIKSLSNKIWRTLFLFYFYWEWVLFLFIISLEELRHWERQITLGLMYPISSNCPMQIYVIEMSTAVWDHSILLHCTQGKLFKINWHEYLMKEKRIFLFVLFFSPFLPQPASPCFLFLLFFFFTSSWPNSPSWFISPFPFQSCCNGSLAADKGPLYSVGDGVEDRKHCCSIYWGHLQMSCLPSRDAPTRLTNRKRAPYSLTDPRQSEICSTQYPSIGMAISGHSSMLVNWSVYSLEV